MKTKLLNTFLLIALFGIALGFFGMLYEGVTLIPKMLNSDLARLQFWHDFYSFINPIFFYIPLVPISTIIIICFYFKADQNSTAKKELAIAVLFQLLTLGLTFYIVTQINLKFYLSDIEKNFELISYKTKLINVISIVRFIFAAIAMRFTFRSYMIQKRII